MTSIDTKRNVGIDLLRILLMFFIIIGHCLVHTTIRDNLLLFSGKWFFTWGIQTFTSCAVNCFILITGYFMANKSFHCEHIAKLWIKVWIYSMLLWLISTICGFNVLSFKAICQAIFPILSNVWWFMSAYILLYLFSPFLNSALQNISIRKLTVLFLLIIVIFYLLPIFQVIFPLVDKQEGMGIMGFITLYIIGAYLAKAKFSLSVNQCLVGLVANNLIVLLSKVVFAWWFAKHQLNIGSSLFYHYNTIFQLLNAVLLFLLFKQMKFITKFHTSITYVSASVFAIYLIHEYPLIRNLLWRSGLYQVFISIPSSAH